MSISARNRDFTQPTEMHSQVFLRGWSNSATNPGIPATTGLWRAVALDPSGYLQVNLQPSTSTFQTVITGATGSQLSIPVGAYNWNIVTQSGTAYLNGFPIFVGTITDAGNGIGGKLDTPLNVGITGGRILVTYDI